jgi:uncharacterized protein YqeY
VASDLKARLQADLNKARKDRDKDRTLVLSTLLSEIRNKEIDEGKEADDDAVIQVVSKGIKQRKDAAEQMKGAGRPELADVEEAQAAVLGEYLPEGLTEDEVRAMVREAIAAGADQMGPLMGRIMPQIRGRFDGKEANRIVREELGG